MPNNDGTGPMSRGPLTGRGLGNCGCARHSIRTRCYERFRNIPLANNEERKQQLTTELKNLEHLKKTVEQQLQELN